jgi:CBS domain-containing protein
MTAISLGSGLVGGIFAPAMFLGASLGAAYGKILAAVIPLSMVNIAAPPAYAMVGMAAVLAGSARAPLTAILLLFELTRDYRIVLPLMAAVGLSIWLVERFQPAPQEGQNLQQLGLNVEKDQNLEILQEISVAEAMQAPVVRLTDSMSVLEAGLTLTTNQAHSALVVNDTGELMGIVTLHDINRAISLWERSQSVRTESDSLTANLTTQLLGAICTTEILYAYPDEPVADALDRMAARGLRQLPVVARDNPHHVLGVLEKEMITVACSVAVTRKALCQYLVTSSPH